MNVVITGAAGFLGLRLTNFLLEEHSSLPVARLLLVDLQPPPPNADPRVSTLALDLAEPAAAELVVRPGCDVLFHLAAVVSGQAELDFDLGLRANLDATRQLVDAARRLAPALRFVFASTVGVYGGHFPAAIDESTAATPQSSYGAEKAMCELLLNEYGRRGYVDARIVRLPTVSVRAGEANRAVTSFASGIVREPLRGMPSVCPVSPEQKMWLSSPGTVVRNIARAAALESEALGPWRVLNLPGICVSVSEMLAALREVAGAEVASLVRLEPNDAIAKMVGSVPSELNADRAIRLGFVVDLNFADIIRQYMCDSASVSTSEEVRYA